MPRHWDSWAAGNPPGEQKLAGSCGGQLPAACPSCADVRAYRTEEAGGAQLMPLPRLLQNGCCQRALPLAPLQVSPLCLACWARWTRCAARPGVRNAATTCAGLEHPPGRVGLLLAGAERAQQPGMLSSSNCAGMTARRWEALRRARPLAPGSKPPAFHTLPRCCAGAKNYPALGVNLQKAIVTTLATAAGICLLWAHAGGLMAAAGQEPAVAAGAARFLLLCTPALFCAGLFECLKRYLMAQGVVAPVTGVSLAAVLLAPPFNWALIFKAGLGLDGAAAAMVATWVTMLCMLGAYVAWHERRRRGTPQQTWHGWCGPAACPCTAAAAAGSLPALQACLPAVRPGGHSAWTPGACPAPEGCRLVSRPGLASPQPPSHCTCTCRRSRDCLKGLGAYYRLAVPSTLMVCLEWWACE